MATLTLDREETSLLKQILESYLSDLRMEIADTDSQDFREQLKSKKKFVEELVRRL